MTVTVLYSVILSIYFVSCYFVSDNLGEKAKILFGSLKNLAERVLGFDLVLIFIAWGTCSICSC